MAAYADQTAPFKWVGGYSAELDDDRQKPLVGRRKRRLPKADAPIVEMPIGEATASDNWTRVTTEDPSPFGLLLTFETGLEEA